MKHLYKSLYSMKDLLTVGQEKGFAVGAFSARYTPFISSIFKAGEALHAPLMVQICQIELQWFNFSLEEFASQFWAQYDALKPSVPVGLHLDHTKDFELIKKAIDLGFSSVMIDSSDLELEENIAKTKQVVDYAHPWGVSVEAELGRIGTADFMESDHDEELFTDPEEAAYFVKQTGVDALAVSVGTAHGVYMVRQPRIDVERLRQIRALTPVALVLHGGSGTPADLIHKAIQFPGGGVGKVNVATDLELAFSSCLGLKDRLAEKAVRELPAADLERGLQAVQAVVEDKMANFLLSQGHAADYPGR